MMGIGRIIVFEGIDGSGKSLISKLVAEKMGAHHLESPIGIYRQMREEMSKKTPEAGQFLFYMASNLYLSEEMKKIAKSKDVVCSRYYFSSLIDYSTRMGLGVDELMERLPLSHSHFIKPDLTVLLTVDEAVQRDRLMKRNPSSSSGQDMVSDRLCLRDGRYRDEVVRKYLSAAYKEGWLVVDNSRRPTDDVLAECLRKAYRT